MDQFTSVVLSTINCVSETVMTPQSACDYGRLDFSKFNLEEASVVETGGFVPFGKKMVQNKHYLSIDSFKSIWDELK